MNIENDLKHFLKIETQKCLKFNGNFSILILGTDNIIDLAIDLAKMGANITLIDLPENEKENRQKVLKQHLKERFCFLPFYLPELPNDSSKNFPYDLIYITNCISQMTYAQAGYFIEDLMQKLHIGGKIFISTFGLESEFGKKYPHKEKNVRERFCPIQPQLAQKYHIERPVCLYSLRDLNALLNETGMSVLREFVNFESGNIESIAVRI